MRQSRRRMLGQVELDDQLEEEFDRSGILEVWFTQTRPDATFLSVDGNRTTAWIAPSGEVAGLLVQDYANGETRTIPFEFGEIEIVNDGARLTIFLRRR